MRSSAGRFISFALLTASFLLVCMGIYKCSSGARDGGTDVDGRPEVGTEPDTGTQLEGGEPAEPTGQTWPREATRGSARDFGWSGALDEFAAPPNQTGPVIRFVGPMRQPRGVSAVVGAPGLWPSVHVRGDERGGLALPEPEVTTLRGDGIEHYEVLARTPAASLAFWGDVYPAEKSTYEMSAAGPLEIHVMNTSVEPVAGVRVSVGRGVLGFVQLVRQTDTNGVARFPAVPSGDYRVQLRKGDRRGRAAIRHDADASDPDAAWVTLRPASEARAELPTPSEAASFGDGSASSGASGDDEDVDRKPVDTTVRLTVKGLETSTWRQAEFRWRVDGESWQVGRLQRAEEGRLEWGKQVTGSTIEFDIQAGERRAGRRFKLRADGTDVSWRVNFERRVSVFVVDGTGAPVRGAKIFVWRGDRGPQLMLSGGASPRKLTVPLGADAPEISVGAVRAGMGEAWQSVSAGASEVTLRLEAAVHTHAWPGRIMELNQLETALQVDLVEIDGGVRFDPLPGGWASRHGVERGDWLVSAQRAGEGAMLHISKGGTHETLDVPRQRMGE